jgi:hypothetical protein
VHFVNKALLQEQFFFYLSLPTMQFAKGVTKALGKGNKDPLNANKAEVPVLSLVPEEGEYDEDDPSKMGSFKLLSDPNDADSAKYIFRMGFPDGSQSIRFHIQWKKNVGKVLRGMQITTGPTQLTMVEEMCSGAVLSSFRSCVLKLQTEQRVANAQAAVQAEPPQDVARAETHEQWLARGRQAYGAVLAGALPDPTVIHVATAVEQAAASMIPYKALERQKRFMRRKMRKPADMTIRQYAGHLVRINDEELPHLPPYSANQRLSGDEMLDIIMFGIPKSWEKEMNKQDFDPFRNGFTMRQLVEFCERIEATEDPTVARSNTNSNKKAKTSGPGKGKTAKPEGKYCEYHDSTAHDTSECEALKKLKAKGGTDKSSNNNKTWTRKSAEAKKFTKKEINMIVKKARDKAYKKTKKELNSIAKRKKSDDDDDDKSVESLNVIDNKLVPTNAKIDKINRAMDDVDAQLKKFDFNSVDV